MVKILSYVKDRLAERSTWTAIGAGVIGAAALSAPWDYLFAVIGVIGTLVPTTQKEGGD